MKGIESHRKSYEKQKLAFEAARTSRITNRNIQIAQIQEKIQDLLELQKKLELQNSNEKEFESFESFRKKAEEQSRKQKNEESSSEDLHP